MNYANLESVDYLTNCPHCKKVFKYYDYLSHSEICYDDIYNNNIGNVGIGTASPSYKLDVTGTARVTQGVSWGDGSSQPGTITVGQYYYLFHIKN